MRMGAGIILASGLAMAMGSCSPAQSNHTNSPQKTMCADYNPSDNLYWGDLHVHTAYSMDAFVFGTTSLPSDAFDFAKGNTAQFMPDGTEVKLKRPLDFAAVTDHAEMFGVMHICTEDHHGRWTEYCQKLRNLSGTDAENSLSAFRGFLLPIIAGEKPKPAILCEQEDLDCEMAALERWQNVQTFANNADNPCDFSAFIGYEWSATPGSSHWHRNLIFKGRSVTNGLVDYVKYPQPERMWAELEAQCRPEDGCEVLAIPHNTNLSEGGGFDVENAGMANRRLRAKYERLIEITQSKGTSECLNENWDDYDADCGFETYLLPQTRKALKENPDSRKTFNRSFARNILSRGLVSYKDSGGEINPLQLGIIGSTDNHTASPGLVEEAFWRGDAWGGGDSFRPRWLSRLDYSPGGLVAVWAKENTRETIFDALKARHAYATSGTRISLRFAVQKDDREGLSCEQSINTGVPMGSTIKKLSTDQPIFTVQANQDIAPLSRIQIVKGTLKSDKIHEKVFTVHENPAGFSQNCAIWLDPEFDPEQPAYWYIRVEEVPTPRWSKLVCQDLGSCAKIPDANRMIKERAWSSPIWYLPVIDDANDGR